MLVLVHSCMKNIHRLNACASTWADDDTLFVLANPDLGEEAQLRGNVLTVRSIESYEMLPMKTYLSTKWAYEQGLQQFLKCDDDTYVHRDNLKQQNFPAQYTGYDVGPWGYTDCPSYASGGGGYVLGRQAMACVTSNMSRFEAQGSEDCVLGHLLLDNNIFLTHDTRFMPSAEAPYKVDGEVTVHLHRLAPELMLEHHRLNQP